LGDIWVAEFAKFAHGAEVEYFEKGLKMDARRVILRRVSIIVLTTSLMWGQQRVVVRPADTGKALRNPGMGWVFHHYDNAINKYGTHLEPSDTVDDFPGASVVYLRLAWSYLEPEEGRFNWAILDTPAQRWIAKGFQIALRISCSESSPDQPYATPKWVQEAGAQGFRFTPRKGVDPNGSHWEPKYDDPVFLAKLDRFLAALAARYDGSPEVAFIDVGSFGVWGEGHTGSSTRLPYDARTVRLHLDLYRKHFKRTLLAVNDDFSNQGRGLEVIHYARELGMTLRDDSILVECGDRAYHHAYLADLFWPQLPVILEMEHYGHSVNRGCWQDGSLYLKAIEDYHASYASVHWWPREFLEKNRELVDRINLRLGYRIQLLEASWPAEVSRSEPLLVGYRWRNVGVAPCYRGGYPAITLKDAKGGIAAVFVDEEFDVRTLPVGAPGKAEPVGREVRPISQASRPLAAFRLPPREVLKPGTYDLFISVGSRTGTPEIMLPLPEDDGQRRYRLGVITIKD
jgi:hypothetical protein